MAVIVEKRDIVTVVVHGSLAGLVAGLALGAATVVASVVLSGSVSGPFRFVSAFVAGPEALDPGFPLGAAVLLGVAIYLSLATLFGVLFVGLMSLMYQLSARPSMLLLYGSVFGFGIWQVSFLVAVPTLFPYLVDRIDFATQLWNGVLSYVFVYGPLLGAYVALVRPGVIGDWRAVGPPAGIYLPPGHAPRD